MNTSFRPWCMALTASLLLSPLFSLAASRDKADSKSTAKTESNTVELFSAIREGQIEVKFIPKDSKTGNVIITNKTSKPLSIKLPGAFAGVPVLAQFGGLGGMGGMGGGGMGGMGGGGMGGMGGGNQGMGGGFGGGMGGMGGGGMGGGGMGGMGGGGGFFNVAAEKVGKIKVATVCLEHGKADPNPRIAYELRPIESFTDKAEVVELCKMVGRGEISQNVAQAVAWHLANGLTWEQLAAKDRIKHLNGTVEKYFTPEELLIAMRVANEAELRGKDNPLPSPTSKATSLSQR